MALLVSLAPEISGNLIAMTRALEHRGPDGEGFYEDDLAHVFLGHRRLAIIDLAGGYQPMPNEDHTIFVIFNGEIYNHAILRKELIARGHVLPDGSFGYRSLGPRIRGMGRRSSRAPQWHVCVCYLRQADVDGYFLRAIDLEKSRYIIYAKPGLFAFASELTGILEHPLASRSLDFRSVQKFFAHGYLPAPNALYEHCRKLPGGCHLTYDIDQRHCINQPLLAF